MADISRGTLYPIKRKISNFFLILSVDIIGSTPFKTSDLGMKPSTEFGIPFWAHCFDTTFSEIAETVAFALKNDANHVDENGEILPIPRLWKTRGDELLMICGVYDSASIGRVISVFLLAVANQRRSLRSVEVDGNSRGVVDTNLSLKSTIWSARFPVENFVMREGASDKRERFYFTKQMEKDLLKSPHLFDLLGPEIDAGFRLSTFATEEETPISIELAFALSRLEASQNFPHIVRYKGREYLKGVKYGKEYPVFILRTNDNSVEFINRSHFLCAEDRVLGREQNNRYFEELAFSWMIQNQYIPFRAVDDKEKSSLSREQIEILIELQKQRGDRFMEFQRAQQSAFGLF